MLTKHVINCYFSEAICEKYLICFIYLIKEIIFKNISN